ncbi:MAG: hypothetical protein ACKKMR_00685 [Candidatus Nealsonbacteria bacterium]
MKKESIKTRSSETWIEDNIMMIRMWGKIDKEEVERITEAGIKITKNLQRRGIIVDISEIEKVSLEARRFVNESPEIAKHVRKKVALVYKNPMARIIGSFFLKLNKPSIEVELFPTVEKAKKWTEEK